MAIKVIGCSKSNVSNLLDSSAAINGKNKKILIARLDISMVADDADLLNSSATANGWRFDHINATIKKYTENGVPFARAVYNDMSVNKGQTWPSIYYSFNGLAPQEFYFQFYARRNGAGGGCKFVKAFDVNNGNSANYYSASNTTWNNNYSSSDIGAIGFGDGTDAQNDSQQVCGYGGGVGGNPIRFPNQKQNILPRTAFAGSGWTAAEWGDGSQWHLFQMRIKFNSGTSLANEVNDGILETFIDGVQRQGAYNIMNRHFASLGISQIEFLSYMQDQLGFTLDIRDITISTGGWVD